MGIAARELLFETLLGPRRWKGLGSRGALLGSNPQALDCFGAPFAGPNANAVIQWQDEDFAVPNFPFFATPTTFDDRGNRRLDKSFIDRDLQLHLAAEVRGEIVFFKILRASFLSTESLAIHDRQAKDLDISQSRFDGLKRLGLDDGDDQFHGGEQGPRQGEIQSTARLSGP